MYLAILALLTMQLTRPDESRVTAQFECPPDRDFFPLVIQVSGRDAAPHSIANRVTSLGFAWGQLESSDPSDLSLRIEDHLLLVQRLREGQVPGWNGEILWLAEDIGCPIIARVAPQVLETKAVATISGAGGTYPVDEALWSYRRKLIHEGVHKNMLRARLEKALEKLSEALVHPNADHRILGQSYRYWSEIVGDGCDPVLSLSCPVFVAHAVDDEEIPVEGADNRVAKLKEANREVTYLRLETGEHDLLDQDAVWDRLSPWMRSVLP